MREVICVFYSREYRGTYIKFTVGGLRYDMCGTYTIPIGTSVSHFT
jgi:hypothetical protein